LEAIKSRQNEPLSVPGADPELLFQDAIAAAGLKSQEWSRLAADPNLSEQASAVAKRIAGLWLGVIMLGGIGLKWVRMAADPTLSEESASEVVQQTTRNWRAVTKQRQYAESAAEQCDAEAQYYFGEAYYEKPDYALAIAIEWWRKAAEQGCQAAQYRLGCAYSEGEGVVKDYVKAHMWFDLSWNYEVKNIGPYELFTPSADLQMEEIERYMTPTQIADAKRLAREWIESHVS
jgi:hypothetical protein